MSLAVPPDTLPVLTDVVWAPPPAAAAEQEALAEALLRRLEPRLAALLDERLRAAVATATDAALAEARTALAGELRHEVLQAVAAAHRYKP